MAGGPSTPELVAAVGAAGGLGMLAAGYLTPEALDEQLARTAALTRAAWGVNLFLPSRRTPDLAEVVAYGARLAPDAAAVGADLGEPRWEDDALDAKVAVVQRHRPALVTFTFGAPGPGLVQRLRASTGARIGVTVTRPAEAAHAATRGVDLLVVQGHEAGGHRALFRDDATDLYGGPSRPIRELLPRVRRVTDLPLVASGGIATPAAVAEALALGAVAVQAGTAFLCCPEAGTSETHRRALLDRRFTGTQVTRAFTGRPARALRNAFAREHTAGAPAAYPEVHHLTRAVRAAAHARGDAERAHLWAGTAWREAAEEPAGEVVRRLAAGAGAAR